MNFNFVEKTNPNDNSKYKEAQFQSKLVDVSDNVLENVNGTLFVNCTIEFENAQGNTVRKGAIIYKKNLDHGMSVGNTYLTTVRITGDERGPLVSVSHLTNAARATEDDFGFTEEVAPQVQPEAEREMEEALASGEAI